MKDRLIVCLDVLRILREAPDRGLYDIGKMIRDVPGLTVLSGDPNLSLRIEIDPRHADALRRSVQGICLIGKDPCHDSDRFDRRVG